VIWVGHASRVLVAVSRRNELFFSSDIKTVSVVERKFATAGHHRQHARRVRYPEGLNLLWQNLWHFDHLG